MSKLFLSFSCYSCVLSKGLSSRQVFGVQYIRNDKAVLSQWSALCKIFLSCVSDFSDSTIASTTKVLIQLNRTMLWAIGVLSFSLKFSKSNYLENSFNIVGLLVFPSTHEPWFFLSRCLPDEMITFDMKIPVLTVSRDYKNFTGDHFFLFAACEEPCS